ncbi:flagellar motor switch protein FliM [Nocardioides sp. Bht2]|uniref:flagellar motor switch protein FliM n=1 Tax=Nocardioides sp. Bht2 TaxID=3392297 RepID=UPI0039B3A715
MTAPTAPVSAGRARRRNRAATVVPYDFRRPIQLSREHSRILQMGLDGFARQATTLFTSSLRKVCQVTLQGIDQHAYSEYVESLGATTYMTKFAADPIPGTGVIEFPVQAAMSCVDHMLGGPGGDEQPERPLTEIESGIINGLLERLLGELRYALAGIVALEPVVIGQEYSPQFAQIAAGSDVMVVATFTLTINDRPHRMTLCLPFGGMLPHLATAAAPTPVSERERAQRAQAAQLLRAQFDKVPLPVTVRLRTTTVDPAALSELRPGDVVRLSHPAAAPLDVSVADTVFAHATAGARGPRLAALIVATPEENA